MILSNLILLFGKRRMRRGRRKGRRKDSDGFLDSSMVGVYSIHKLTVNRLSELQEEAAWLVVDMARMMKGNKFSKLKKKLNIFESMKVMKIKYMLTCFSTRDPRSKVVY